MIVCAACGTSNRDNERFCGNCGAFLEWEGTRATAEGASAPRTETPPPASTEPEQPAVESPSRTATEVGADPRAATTTTTTAATATTATTAATDAAATTPSPPPVTAVAEPEQATTVERPKEPTAVQPGLAPTHRPRRTVEESQTPASLGEEICPKCGTGNEKTRRFCRTCGNRLGVVEVVEAPLPWWRRLLNRLRNRNKQVGQRRPRRAARRLLWIVSIICLAVVVAVAGPPLVRRGVNEIRDRTQDHVPLTPTGAAASSEGEGTPASRISDGATNKYWAPTGPAVGAWVEATYSSPVRILDVVVTPGISTEQEKFLTIGRPDALEVVATKRNGETVNTTIQLLDQPGPQKFAFEAPDVIRVRLVVQGTYGQKSAPTVAIGEVEFFGRR